MSTTALDPLELVDLARYPIDRLDDETSRAFLTRCRRELEASNACNLPGFIRPGAVATLARESEAWRGAAHDKTLTRNPYHSEDDATLPIRHPLRRFDTQTNLQLAYDQIPQSSLLNRLFLCEALSRFIAAVLGRPVLYPMADRFQALNVIWLRPGDHSTPHFDFNDFTVTLLLEAARGGGDFEFVPDIRSAGEPCYDAVQRVLDGDRGPVRRLERGAGTLTLFRGRNSLHWVTPVTSGMRQTAILCYDEHPDCVASDAVNLKVYGERIRPLLTQ